MAVWVSDDDDLTSARWRSICERFHDIRLGAYRHGLADTWRQLAADEDPATEAVLARWEQLDERILVLDEDDELQFARRGGPTADDDDEWDDDAAEYVCPAGRCDRHEIAYLGLAPRCELFHRDMAQNPARPG